ncbi:MAG: MoaD/ThiS family protein [Methylomonas sp.]|jgi:molybdopterin synthase sulfur carrier subunit|uniref:MoaD/ThiS family protein n=1 Tax=Methylomonas sp. TaxID=418 RepID=UPI0025DE4F94|nr:MoaD/ThiS family protein [Methylomonas sp.]MCK9606998.1 MoaD/ThiS family protein [Methylomonas sp.]
MSIKVRYFASLKESVGRSEDELQITYPLTVHAVWQQLNPDFAMPDAVLAAVNMDYVALDVLVLDGDVLAFFPPVTGG